MAAGSGGAATGAWVGVSKVRAATASGPTPPSAVAACLPRDERFAAGGLLCAMGGATTAARLGRLRRRAVPAALGVAGLAICRTRVGSAAVGGSLDALGGCVAGAADAEQ